jgi:release factor glutamine methyltransferase
MSSPDRASVEASDTTWRELWTTTAQSVGDRATARWMCEVAAGLDGDELLAALDEPATARMLAHLDAMVARFLAGEPLQYVLGRWGFRHLDLAVDRRVLIPRPETELVAEVAIALARAVAPPVRVADLGTGSGAIGLAMADELPLTGTTVWLTDVSADALDVARANLAGIGRAAANVRVAQGSWFEALPAGERFDVIVANPPYVADGAVELSSAVAEWEPHVALFAGADGLDDVRLLVAGAPGHLAPDGWLVLEIGADQGRAVRRLLDDSDYRDVEVRPDLAGRDRIALGRRPPAAVAASVPPDPV